MSRSFPVAIALGLLSILHLLHLPAVLAQKDSYAPLREKMVADYIEREGVSNPRVLDSMRQVPRHEFVTPSMRSAAYFDTALAIGAKQTISPPYIVAYMTETIDPQPTDRVLEIGTGSGYQAAVLSGLVNQVYTIEIVDSLGKQAAERLKKLGYDNVFCKIGDGYLGWAEHAPFDKIIVTCSPEKVPQPLIDQLKEGGRMLIPLGERYQQVFHLMEKKDGKLIDQRLIPTLFVPMTGQSEELRTVLPDPQNPRLQNGGLEIDGNQDGIADHWHYQRQVTLLAEGAAEGQRCWLFENDTPGRMAQALQGLPIDGNRIGSIALAVRYKLADLSTPEGQDPPALVVHFYDAQRRQLETFGLAQWYNRDEWAISSKTIPVPKNAREMIVRVGLHGSTGKLWIDDIRATPRPR